MRRFPSAFLILGVLSLLAVGAVALGVAEAPTGTTLAVHNGAGETLGASRVTGHYTASYLGTDVVSFRYVPGSASLVARTTGGKVQGRRSVSGSNAIGILEPVKALLTVTQFTQHGSLYQSTEPIADIVPARQRATVSGHYRTAVRMAGGYVVSVKLVINAVQAGRQVGETVDYHLTRVGSWGAG